MGVTLLPGFEANVRSDLKDLDPTAYLWTTAEIDRHIQHAVNDYQKIYPLLGAATITVVADASGNTRRQSVGTPLPAGYLWTARVEYPIDDDPPSYRAFREELIDQGTLYLPTGDPPRAGDLLKAWYAKAHTLDASTSTLPTEHEEVITLGAVAYAAQAAARYSASRLNASAWTPRGMAEFAADRMATYLAVLEALRASYSTAGAPQPRWGQVERGWFSV